MKIKPITITFIKFLVALSFCLSTWHAFAQNSSTPSGCPEGFFPAGNGICAAGNFTTSPAIELPPGLGCPEGFERPYGVRFCVPTNASIDIQGDYSLIRSLPEALKGDCPEGFSRPSNSRVCVAEDLVLDTSNKEVHLKRLGAQCPEGFHIPIGGHICVASTMQVKVLPEPFGHPCPPGFVRPPGVTQCFASTILYDSGLENGPTPPDGLCPEGWHRPTSVKFCIPQNIASASVRDSRLGKHTQVNIDPVYEGYGQTPCPEGTMEVWWDMPVYDNEGLFVVDHIPTRVCLPENLEPAG